MDTISEPNSDQLRLRDAEANYRELFDNANDAIYVLDAQTGRVLDVNERAHQLTGFTRAELLTGNIAGLVTGHPDQTLDKALAYIKKAATGERQRFEWQGTDKAGRDHWYEVNLKKVILTGKERVLAFFREIDDRKKAEEELRESEQRLRHSMDNMLEGVQIIGYDWRYKYVNSALAAQAHTTVDKLLGRTMMEAFPGIEHTLGFWYYKRCMEDRLSAHMDNEFSFPDGSTGWFELRMEPVPEGIIILSIDITERMRAQQELRAMNQDLELRVQERTQMLTAVNRTLETFSYSVSHDLRSPLRIIDGYALLLENEHSTHLGEEGGRLLSVIRQNTTRMGRLIDDILEFARLGKAPLVRTHVDMNALARNVWQEQYGISAGNARVVIADLHTAYADKGLIEQVLHNLVSNALKYSAKKDIPEVYIWSEKKDGRTIYCVKDNGTGFDMQYADKLFTVFQRLHKTSEYKGSGVGLAIAESIIIKHDGRIWADSIPGEGAKFCFSLPDEGATIPEAVK
ncbi:hypothetical protein GCM10023093_13190 [Nemorincola caseinilytica]|uniref:histidine kinase n=1 Tax=Nemorincola caseinilytica TaxID=2054315 RepID=A0ABP8NE25_9BACT